MLVERKHRPPMRNPAADDDGALGCLAPDLKHWVFAWVLMVPLRLSTKVSIRGSMPWNFCVLEIPCLCDSGPGLCGFGA